MYPVTLIRISKNRKIEICMKNGDIIRGRLIICDLYMNMRLKDVTLVSGETEKYFVQSFVKGSFIKTVSLPPDVLDIQDKLIS